MSDQEITERELIRILHRGEDQLKIYALRELRQQRIKIPFHELEPTLRSSHQEVMEVIAQYARILPPEERIKICLHLAQTPNHQNLRHIVNLLPRTRYPVDILKLILKQIPVIKEIRLKKDLIEALSPHVPSLPPTFFEPLLRNPARVIPRTVLSLLAEHPKSTFRSLFEEGMGSLDPEIRSISLAGLWRLGSPALIELTKKETCPQFLRSYTRVLGWTGPDPAVQKLLANLSLHADPMVRYEAYLSLEKVGNDQSIPEFLLRAVDEPSLVLCSSIIRTCLGLNEEETIRTLLNLAELYHETGDRESEEKVSCFLSMTPHFQAASAIQKSLKESYYLQPEEKRSDSKSLDHNLVQELVLYLQSKMPSTPDAPFYQKNQAQSLNRFEFSSLLG